MIVMLMIERNEGQQHGKEQLPYEVCAGLIARL